MYLVEHTHYHMQGLTQVQALSPAKENLTSSGTVLQVSHIAFSTYCTLN